MEANLARVESKLDQHMEKVDSRLSRQSEYLLEKLDEMKRELQLSRVAMNETFISRREYTERHADLQKELTDLQKEYRVQVLDFHKEQKENMSKVNMALIGSGLYFISSLVLHFLPNSLQILGAK